MFKRKIVACGEERFACSSAALDDHFFSQHTASAEPFTAFHLESFSSPKHVCRRTVFPGDSGWFTIVLASKGPHLVHVGLCLDFHWADFRHTLDFVRAHAGHHGLLLGLMFAFAALAGSIVGEADKCWPIPSPKIVLPPNMFTQGSIATMVCLTVCIQSISHSCWFFKCEYYSLGRSCTSHRSSASSIRSPTFPSSE